MSPHWRSTTSQEPQVLRDLRAGEERAYAALYRDFWRRLRLVARPFVGSLDDAADIAQDVIVQLFMQRESLNVRDSLEGYLFCAVRNRARDMRRRRRVREQWIQDTLCGVTGELPFISNTIDSADERMDAIELLRRLPPRGREAIQLVYIQGMSYQQAAAQLGVARSTVRTHIRRARQMGHRMKSGWTQ